MKNKGLKIFILLALVMTFSFSGCQKLKDIRITSAEVESLNIRGFRGIDLELAVGVENPSVQVSVSEIQGALKHSGKVIGKLAVAPFILEARTEKTYPIEATVSLAEGAGLRDVMMLTDKNKLNECTVDVSAVVKIRGSKGRTVAANDIPLKELLERVKQ